MAVSEDDDDEQDQGNISTPHGDDVTSRNDSLTGPRNGRHPIPASDLFAAELPQNMEASNLITQTVVGSTGERVTSVYGTPELDVISRTTVLRQQASSTLAPQRDARPEITAKEDTSCNNTSSDNTASSQVVITDTNSQETTEGNDDMLTDTPLSTVPPLSLASLGHDLSDSASFLATATAPVQDSQHGQGAEVSSSSEKGAERSRLPTSSSIVCLRDESKEPVRHFAERSISSQGQKDTSGYNSRDASSSMTSGKDGQKEAAMPEVVQTSGLQLSETGINAIKCESGTRRNPFHPSYSGLPVRLGSFPEGFHLGEGIRVNKDLLALAGFFYSGHGTVTCFHCGCSPRVWGDGRNPEIEHRMLSPYCRALPFPWN